MQCAQRRDAERLFGLLPTRCSTNSAATNNAPVFSGTPTRTVPENSAAGTNVGAVIPEAMDADNDALTYSMEGTDATSFAFNASTRQITTIAGVDYNYEATKNRPTR